MLGLPGLAGPRSGVHEAGGDEGMCLHRGGPCLLAAGCRIVHQEVAIGHGHEDGLPRGMTAAGLINLERGRGMDGEQRALVALSKGDGDKRSEVNDGMDAFGSCFLSTFAEVQHKTAQPQRERRDVASPTTVIIFR